MAVNQISPDGKWQWDGTAWQPLPVPQAPLPGVMPKKKGHLLRNLGIVAGALLLIGIGGAIANSGSNSKSNGGNTAANSPIAQAPVVPVVGTTPSPAVTPTPKASASPTPKPTPTPAGPSLTASQKNAVRAAQSYLSFTAFSRQGLIDQLSSAYGDQYTVQDATIAVDSLNVDWNAEAAQSAKSYLKMSPFSCQGLIDQLDSAYGEQFTVAQATYGAQQAGAC